MHSASVFSLRAKVAVALFAVMQCGCDSSSIEATSPAPPRLTTPAPLTAKREWGRPHFDICALLGKEEIESILHVSIHETRGVGGSDGPLLISQCFYMPAPSTPVVTLAVTTSDPNYSPTKSIEQHWGEMFSPDSADEKAERNERFAERKREEKEHEKVPPRKVEGLGEEAFWTKGTLFVLHDNSVIRLSLGGTDDEEIRLTNAKLLAQKLLQRLRGTTPGVH